MPRKPNKDTPVVSVSIDGRGAAWCDGKFSGDPEIVAFAQRAIECGLEVDLGDQAVLAEGNTPLGITAALCGFRSGRARVMEAPDEVHALIASGRMWDQPEKWSD